MYLANLLVYKQKKLVEQQVVTVNTLKKVTILQQKKAKTGLSNFFSRADTLGIIFAAGWLKGHFSNSSNSSDSNKIATSTFVLRLLNLIT